MKIRLADCTYLGPIEEPETIKAKAREVNTMAETQTHEYLASEDRFFCLAFRLSEDTFLELHGGLGKYKQHQLDREQARATTPVPRLPTSILAEHLETMRVAKLDEKSLAQHLVDQQKDKTTEGLKTAKMNESFAALKKTDDTNKAVQAKQQHDRLVEEVRIQYGYLPGTQSSEDAIAGKMDEIKRGLRT